MGVIGTSAGKDKYGFTSSWLLRPHSSASQHSLKPAACAVLILLTSCFTGIEFSVVSPLNSGVIQVTRSEPILEPRIEVSRLLTFEICCVLYFHLLHLLSCSTVLLGFKSIQKILYISHS
jgi:hypothetical protein